MKRILSLALSLSVVLSLFGGGSIGAFAVEHQTSVPTGYTGIYSAQDLRNIDNDLEGKFILMNDIDLSEWGNWAPIGASYNSPFSGVFDGNGYVLLNLKITDAIYVGGLFGFANKASVRNLKILNANISGCYVAGGIVGVACFTDIKNCVFNGVISTEDGNWQARYDLGGFAYLSREGIGGIVGYMEGGSIAECTNNASITQCLDSSPAGGIIGHIRYSGNIDKCDNSGSIVNSRAGFYSSAGGIVGNSSSADTTISKCYNAGSVFATGKYAGGIVGTLSYENGTGDSSRVQDCYNTGIIQGAEASGGIIGCSNFGHVFNCYSLGELVESVETGNIIGHIYKRSEVKYCYYIDTSPYLAVSEGYLSSSNGLDFDSSTIKALSASQMKQQSSFAGFDFNTVWEMGASYPVLRGMSSVPEVITPPTQEINPPVVAINTSSISPGNNATISWNAVPGADSYIVSYMDTGKAKTQATTVTGTSYEIKGLSKGNYLFYVMSVYDSIGFCSNPSNIVKLNVVNELLNTKYSQTVTKGTIRYICQTSVDFSRIKTDSPLFYDEYWRASNGQGNSSAKGKNYYNASIECQTCCISMALSYLGINRTPADLFNNYWSNYQTVASNVGTEVALKTGSDSNTFKTMFNSYQTNSDFSPVWVKLTNYSSTSQQHYVLIYAAKESSPNTYLAVDPYATTEGIITFEIVITPNNSTNPTSYTLNYLNNRTESGVNNARFWQYELN